MLLASTLGQIAHPFYVAFAWLMAVFYSVIPNYAIAIALLTLAVMVVVFPITRRGTRSMMKMQLLSPEMKKLQAKYKTQPGMPPAERNAQRQAMNEEMMALYKENGVSPTGGCLPMFLQFPIFLILYGTIRGLTATTTIGKGAHAIVRHTPLYIGHSTLMYKNILHAHGKLMAFGINLGNDALTHGLSVIGRVPYILMILAALVLQYIQMKQMSGRNPAAKQANPQMQQMQKVMPLIFAVIYIRIAAGVNVYFVVSSLFRIAQQEYMYRHDPDLRGSLEKLRARSTDSPNPKVVEAKARITAEQGRARGGLLGRLLPTPALASGEGSPGAANRGGASPAAPRAKSGSEPGAATAKPSGQRPRPPRPPRPARPAGNGTRAQTGATRANGANGSRPRPARTPTSTDKAPGKSPPRPQGQPRAQGKRQRRSR